MQKNRHCAEKLWLRERPLSGQCVSAVKGVNVNSSQMLKKKTLPNSPNRQGKKKNIFTFQLWGSDNCLPAADERVQVRSTDPSSDGTPMSVNQHSTDGTASASPQGPSPWRGHLISFIMEAPAEQDLLFPDDRRVFSGDYMYGVKPMCVHTLPQCCGRSN